MRRAALMVLVLAGSAPAATLRVPDDVPSLLAAADLAVPGDSILLGAGVWTDLDTRIIYSGGLPYPLTSAAFLRGGVTIVGEGGAESTIVDGLGRGTEDSFFGLLHMGEKASEGPLVLDGLTIRGAAGGKGGQAVLCYWSDGLVIRNCRLEDNEYGSDLLSGTALATYRCPLDVSDTLFLRNRASGAVADAWEGEGVFRRCTFRDNTGICIDGESVGAFETLTVEDCEFYENEGVGVWVSEKTSLELVGSEFVRNTGPNGSAGIYLGGVNATVEDCTFAFNNFSGGGTSILWDTSEGYVRGNTFLSNSSGIGSGCGVRGHQWRLGSICQEHRCALTRTGRSGLSRWNQSPAGKTAANVFWNNEGGHSKNWTHAANDLFLDPEICDLEGEVWGVASTSPCIDPGDDNCPQIGAHGVSCTTSPVEPMTWGRIKNAFRSRE